MAIKSVRPTTPGRRHAKFNRPAMLAKSKPPRSLLGKTLKKTAGRNSTGKITIRARGGGHKRKFRHLDFKRNKKDIQATVKGIYSDPNRSSLLAHLVYADGEQRFILAPQNLKVGSTVISSDSAEIKPGNTLPLGKIPVGTPIHNLELVPGKGGQIVRSAGSFATIQSKEGDYTTVQLPSREVRLVKSTCLATVGQVGNPEHQNIKLGKAGLRRHLGFRPRVRGSAKHPAAHPHGGGEGRAGVGLKHPKTPWGKPALGKKTRKVTKYSDKHIIKDRRSR